MSLILEALKKSERQRRLGESPTFGSPVIAVRRRRSLLPILIALIAIGLLALWWLRRESAAPEQPAPVATAPASAANKSPAEPANEPGSSVFNDAALPAAASRPLVDMRNPRKPAAGSADADRRRKLRDGELVAANPEAGAAATIKESEPISAADPAAMAAAMADAGTPAPSTTGSSAPGKPVVADTSKADEPALNPRQDPGNSRDLKLMWELPLATRQKLPEIKLSMHVFAKDSAQRFVIINGDRHVQGDDIDGMVLSEIRADGVVFEREGVRFLYPRGGR